MLELCCNTSGTQLWNIFTGEANVSRFLTTNNWTFQLQIMSRSNFTFSRVFDSSNLPLISKLLISPIYTDMNGTEINCVDLATSTSSSAIVYVMNEDSNHDEDQG